jgi:hypothetical protein
MSPTNFYFDHYENQAEQTLLSDWIEEAIQIHGDDVWYVVRTLGNYDKILGADDSSTYGLAYMIEMYVKSVRGYGGDKDFLRQFGAEVREEVTFTVSQRAFNNQVGADTGFIRPREGDLIYFPPAKKCFMIKFADQREMFYQLGATYTYELTCELYEYSGEKFETGISEIDSIAELSTNIVDWAILTEDDEPILTEDGDYIVVDGYDLEAIAPDASNDELEEEFDTTVDWTDIDPFSEGQIGNINN